MPNNSDTSAVDAELSFPTSSERCATGELPSFDRQWLMRGASYDVREVLYVLPAGLRLHFSRVPRNSSSNRVDGTHWHIDM